MMVPHSVTQCGPVKMRMSPVYNLGTPELMLNSGIALILETSGVYLEEAPWREDTTALGPKVPCKFVLRQLVAK
jgi:hypothetical protein